MNNTLQNVVRFDSNEVGIDWVIGDLHGCLKEFYELLAHINFNPKVDRIFSVGDLIDRGEDSEGCLKLIDNPWFFSVRGNHEQLMYDAIMYNSWDDYSIWQRNGGSWGQSLNNNTPGLLQLLCENYITKMPLVMVVCKGLDRFNIVHGEFFSNRSIGDIDIDNWTFSSDEQNNMLWGRNIIQFFDPTEDSFDVSHENLSKTYVGHTPLQHVQTIGSQHYIDTGAFFAVKAMSGTSTDLGLTIVNTKTNEYTTYHSSLDTFSNGILPTINSVDPR